MPAYDHQTIEKKWQAAWEKAGAFKTPEISDGNAKKKYILNMFPYPSGSGLHVGHLLGYTGTDIVARTARMQGFKVLHPMGWDAFGLPAENFAIKSGVHPALSTDQNTAEFKRQFRQAGITYDWDKEIDTSKPEYYKWTQWLFAVLYERGLAYRKEGLVNWCPKDQTVLANEQAQGGVCDRCGTPVVQKQLKQWYFKITDYADRLIDGLDELDWPEKIKLMQRNWIGKSEGAQVWFKTENGLSIEVFTTRPDTLFGATYLVLAPEHSLVESLTTPDQLEAVKAYQKAASRKNELERTFLGTEKTGVFTGSYAINPASGKRIPIWIADYVISTYGTGAIMAVPAHDDRDYEFATAFDLPIIQVIAPDLQNARSYLMGGKDITDADLENTGVSIIETTDSGARKLEIPNEALPAYESLVAKRLEPGFWNEYVGSETVFNFKHKDGRMERLVLTPENHDEINRLAADFNGEGTDGAGSVWTWLSRNDWYTERIIHHERGILINSGAFSGRRSLEVTDDLLTAVGGQKKTTYRLRDWLVSRQRFWGAPIPVVVDAEGNERALSIDELPVELPMDVEFQPTGQSPLVTQAGWRDYTDKNGKHWTREAETLDTFVCSSWYFLRYPTPNLQTAAFDPEELKKWLPVDIYSGGAEHAVLHLLYARFITKVLHDAGYLDFEEPFLSLHNQGMILGPDHQKMSKSKGNVISPDDMVRDFGADSMRTYEMFMAPFDTERPWNTKGVVGVRRFLDKVWRLQEKLNENASTETELRCINRVIRKVTDDIAAYRFNTAVSSMMEAVNELTELESLSKNTFELLILVLNPFAPHITEELWSTLGHMDFCSLSTWPEVDEHYLVAETVEYPVQVNGKVRYKVIVANGTSKEDVLAAVRSHERYGEVVGDKPVKKEIVVPDRLVSLVL